MDRRRPGRRSGRKSRRQKADENKSREENAASIPDLQTAKSDTAGSPCTAAEGSKASSSATANTTTGSVSRFNAGDVIPKRLSSLSRVSRSEDCTSRARSVSPARLMRQKEHEEMQTLNTRLSSLADHVKQLQAENSRLKLQLDAMNDIVKRETRNIKVLHGSEIKSLQEMLDASNEEKSRYLTEKEKAEEELCRLREQITEKDAETSAMHDRLESLQTRSSEYEKLLHEHESTQKALNESQEDAKRLSAELLKEKRANKRLEDEASCNKERYLNEVEEASARLSAHMQQADKRLEKGYEEMIGEALSSLRDQHAKDLEELREELTTTYQTKISELRSTFEVTQADLLVSKRELKAARQDQDKLRDQATHLKAENASLQVQLSEFQNRTEELKDENERNRCQSQREKALLTQELAEVKEELEEMGGANSKLESQIHAYKVIVDDLEEKTPVNSKKHGTRQGEEIYSQLQYMFSEKKKRKKNQSTGMEKDNQKMNETNLNKKPSYFRTNEYSQGLDILDVDIQGKYITLINTTDHPTDLCLWTVQQTDPNGCQVKYEIPKSIQLAKGKKLIINSHTREADQVKENCNETELDGERYDQGDNNSCPDDLQNIDDEQCLKLSMQSKSWLKLDGSLTIRVEDGDGQLQAKCDIASLVDKVPPEITKKPRLETPITTKSCSAVSRSSTNAVGKRGPPSSESSDDVYVTAANSATCVKKSRSMLSHLNSDSGIVEFEGPPASLSFIDGGKRSDSFESMPDFENMRDKDRCLLM